MITLGSSKHLKSHEKVEQFLTNLKNLTHKSTGKSQSTKLRYTKKRIDKVL